MGKQINSKTTISFSVWHLITIIFVVIGSFIGYYGMIVSPNVDRMEKHYKMLYDEQKEDIRTLNKKIDDLNNAINNLSNNVNILNEKLKFENTIKSPGIVSLHNDTTQFSDNIVENINY